MACCGSGFKLLLQHPRECLIVIGLTMGGTLAFYVYTTYMQKFLKLSVGLTDAQTTAVSAGSLVFAALLQPVYGALSDKIGRKPLLLGFAILGTLFTVPLLTAIRHAQGPWEAFGLIACAWLIVSGYTSINAVVKAELFPASIRATGVGVPQSVVDMFTDTVTGTYQLKDADGNTTDHTGTWRTFTPFIAAATDYANQQPVFQPKGISTPTLMLDGQQIGAGGADGVNWSQAGSLRTAVEAAAAKKG